MMRSGLQPVAAGDTLKPNWLRYSQLRVIRKQENRRPPHFLGSFLDSCARPPQFSRRPVDRQGRKALVFRNWSQHPSNGENLRFSRFRPSSLKCPSRYSQVPRLLSSWRVLGGTYSLAYLHTCILGTGV